VNALSATAGVVWSVAFSIVLAAVLLSAGSIVAGEDSVLYGALAGFFALLLIALLLLARRRAPAFRVGQIAGLAIMAVAVPIGLWKAMKRHPVGVVRRSDTK
jgi:hypothetical protein